MIRVPVTILSYYSANNRRLEPIGLNSATAHIAIMYGIAFLHMPTCLAKRETYGYYSSVRQNWRQNKLEENESPPVKELQSGSRFPFM